MKGFDILYKLKLILFMLICLSGTVYSQTSSKTLYGFTAFPYDLTLEAVETVNTLVTQNSSLYAVHNMGFNDCLPWQEALTESAFPQWIQDDWNDIKARIPEGMPLTVHITPTQSDRYTMSYQCGVSADQAGEMPAELEGRPYNDPLIISAYLNFARRVADFFKPDFLTLGIEMSELSLNHPDEWQPFADLMIATLEGLRSSHPDVQLSVEFVLQSLLLPRVAAQVKPLVEQLDFLGISFYPYGTDFGEFYGAPALPEPPDQWRKPLEWLSTYTDKPIAIVETGYTSKSREVFGLNFPGTEDLQKAFLEDLLTFAQNDNYVFLVWFVPVDYEKLLEKLPTSEGASVAEIWVNAGLWDSNLKPKPALETWQRLVSTDLPASSLPLLGDGFHLGTTFYSSGRVPENPETLSAINEAVMAGMSAFHFNEDWQALDVASGVYNLEDFKATLTWLKRQGLRPYLNISVVDINDLNVPAEYLDGAGNLKGVRFDDPAFITRFKQLLDEIVPLLVQHGGFYLGVGNEVDERFSEYPEELSSYLEFVAAVREHVHTIEPRLAVGVTVTGNAVLKSSPIVLQLKAVSDVIPFNYYPLNNDLMVKDFSLIPNDIKALVAAYGDNPIIIQELGCPSADVMNSSLEHQRQCFKEMFAALAVYPNIRFVSMFTFQDFDPETCDTIANYFNLDDVRQLEGVSEEYLERFRAFLCTLGLRNADGSAKPAWQAFINELETIARE